MEKHIPEQIEQDGYNAYGYIGGKRVPVLSTSMGNCWHQDDQREFCVRLVKEHNNYTKLLEVLRKAVQRTRVNSHDWIQDAATLLTELEEQTK